MSEITTEEMEADIRLFMADKMGEAIISRLNNQADQIESLQSELSALRADVGVLPDGAHPDEAKPRGKTWLCERENWAIETGVLREQNRALQSEISRLRPVVEAMPKTGDGVPIVFGMTVWFWDEEAPNDRDVNTHHNGAFVETKVSAIYRKGFDEYRGTVAVGVEHDWEGGNLEYFSTREAAIASLSQPKIDELERSK